MKLNKVFTAGLFATLLSASAVAAADEMRVGVVDFKTCLESSYLGQQETNKLEAMRNEMVSTLESKEKLLTDVMNKLRKPEYLDTISPQAEEELQKQYAQLSEEISMLQNQAYQTLNQAQMKMIQTLSEQISKSSEYLAREQNLDMIINQESCFYFKRPLEITPLVVQELNRHFQPDIAKANDEDSGDIN